MYPFELMPSGLTIVNKCHRSELANSQSNQHYTQSILSLYSILSKSNEIYTFVFGSISISSSSPIPFPSLLRYSISSIKHSNRVQQTLLSPLLSFQGSGTSNILQKRAKAPRMTRRMMPRLRKKYYVVQTESQLVVGDDVELVSVPLTNVGIF